MADFGFGEQLANARRGAGLSIQQVSDALRIRNDIIRSIEMQDFAHMPAKAFSRNQVSAYARYLGLDPNAITRSFLAAYSNFEHEAAAHAGTVTNIQQPSNNRAYLEARKAKRAQDEIESKHRLSDKSSRSDSEQRSHGAGSGSNRQRRPEGDPREQRQGSSQRRCRPDGAQDGTQRRSGQRSRNGSGAGNRSRNGSAPSRQRGGNQSGAGNRNRKPSQASNGVPGQRTTRKQRSIAHSIGTRPLEGDTFVSSLLSRLDIKKVAIAVAAIVIFIILVTTLSRCGASSNSTPDLEGNGGTSTVQVTGGTSSTESKVSNEQATAITATPDIRNQSATSFKLEVSLDADHSSWMQIETDDTTPVAEQVQGPQNYEYTVTSKAVLEIGNPSYVTVKVNSKEVELNTTEDGLGTLTITRADDGTVTTAE